MSYKGELQTLTKPSMRYQVSPSETCRVIKSESILTMLMSRGRSNCGVTYYIIVYYLFPSNTGSFVQTGNMAFILRLLCTNR